jgi:hypothetical protein
MVRTAFRPKRRPTGFPRAVVAAAIDRDQWCVLCGLVCDPRQLTGHHRRNRGAGGSSDPETNSVRNCLALCWPCNGLAESSAVRAREARERGVKLLHGWSLDTPVLYPDGAWYVLDERGQRTRTEAAA